MGIEDPNFWAAMLGGGIVGAIISALATVFFGERWTEKQRLKREHSLKLVNAVLKPWKNKVGEYCKIDAIYSRDADKIVGVEPVDPADLEFYDAAKTHLKSKYADVLEAWEELKHSTSTHNKELAVFLEKLRTLFAQELEKPCYYWFAGAQKPEEHIVPDKLAQFVYEEIAWREPDKRKWIGGQPEVRPIISNDKKFYQLVWKNVLMESLNSQEVERAILLISKLTDAPKFIEEVKDLKTRENEICSMERQNFETRIKDIIESIELGNNLRGECRFCKSI